MSDRSIAGTVGGKGKISSRNLKKLTETAMAQYAAAVSLERNPATFGDAVIDISNNLNVQSANAFSAVKRAFPSAFMDATLGADPAGIRQLPDNLVHLAGLPGLQIQSLSPGSCGAPLTRRQATTCAARQFMTPDRAPPPAASRLDTARPPMRASGNDSSSAASCNRAAASRLTTHPRG